MEQKRNSDLDKFSIIRLIERVDKDRVAQVYQLNYKEFMLLNSDDVEIDGRQVDFIERNLYLMAGKKFSFEACKTKQGFELTENDFLKNQFTIIENGRQYLTQFRHLKQLEIYYDYLISKKASLEKPKPEKKLISFVWQNNAENELPELFSLMLDKYKLIAPETTLEQFKAIFTGQPIETIEPVKWMESNRLLAYFLETAFYGQDWQSIAGNGKLFMNSKNKLLSANDLSVAKKGYKDNGEPKGYEKIDLILSAIKKLS
jgi:hypothetical protein